MRIHSICHYEVETSYKINLLESSNWFQGFDIQFFSRFQWPLWPKWAKVDNMSCRPEPRNVQRKECPHLPLSSLRECGWFFLLGMIHRGILVTFCKEVIQVSIHAFHNKHVGSFSVFICFLFVSFTTISLIKFRCILLCGLPFEFLGKERCISDTLNPQGS